LGQNQLKCDKFLEIPKTTTKYLNFPFVLTLKFSFLITNINLIKDLPSLILSYFYWLYVLSWLKNQTLNMYLKRLQA